MPSTQHQPFIFSSSAIKTKHVKLLSTSITQQALLRLNLEEVNPSLGNPLFRMSGSGNHNNKQQLQQHEDEIELPSLDVVAGIVVIVAGIGLAACFLGSLFSTGNQSRKTMKAPGRDFRIFRDDFEANPSKYFRDLHEL
ncbi:unnamed protein product [Rhodiola kirilowii]